MCDSDWSAADCPPEQICRESQVYPKRESGFVRRSTGDPEVRSRESEGEV